jgi:hypothetical protein
MSDRQRATSLGATGGLPGAIVVPAAREPSRDDLDVLQSGDLRTTPMDPSRTVTRMTSVDDQAGRETREEARLAEQRQASTLGRTALNPATTHPRTGVPSSRPAPASQSHPHAAERMAGGRLSGRAHRRDVTGYDGPLWSLLACGGCLRARGTTARCSWVRPRSSRRAQAGSVSAPTQTTVAGTSQRAGAARSLRSCSGPSLKPAGHLLWPRQPIASMSRWCDLDSNECSTTFVS